MKASRENVACPTESLESVQGHDHVSEHQGLESQTRNAPQPEMNPFMQQFLEMMQRMAPPPQSQPQDQVIDKNYEIVRRQGAKVFTGTTDPAEGEEWLRNMERVFDIIECTFEQKLRYAVSLLEKDALDWWEIVQGSKNRLVNLTNRKKVEFLELKKNDLSVAEYELQFLEAALRAKEISVERSSTDAKRKKLTGVLVRREVGLEAEKWVRLAGLLQCFRVEAALLQLDLEGDKVQPDRSMEDLFLLVLIAVRDTVVNVGEPNQLYVIVAISGDILSGTVLHGGIIPKDLQLQG
ncbi:UNVERIFIED_CONTAM: hypothetical protein Sindi_2478500 [Sesamum indicum]